MIKYIKKNYNTNLFVGMYNLEYKFVFWIVHSKTQKKVMFYISDHITWKALELHNSKLKLKI